MMQAEEILKQSGEFMTKQCAMAYIRKHCIWLDEDGDAEFYEDILTEVADKRAHALAVTHRYAE